jgi:peptidoglycan/LPS O-acetylase OafA/YrhL
MPPGYPTFAVIVLGMAAYVVTFAVAGGMARSGFPLPTANRTGCVDGLRGVLALSVLTYHFAIWLQVERFGLAWDAPANHFLHTLGAGGVAMFFMTTGLVFYPRVLTGPTATDWRAVYVSRLFRIVPLIVFSVLLITAIILLRTHFTLRGPWLTSAPIWLTGYDEPPLLTAADAGRLNAYVLWSIFYEWVFYIAILPALALMMQLGRKALPSWAVTLGLLMLLLAVRSSVPEIRLFRFLPLFLVGMLGHELKEIKAVRHMLSTRTAGAVTLADLLAAMAMSPDPCGLPQLFIYRAFFTAVACGNSMFGLLSAPAARVIGEASFGIYLLHGTVLALLFEEGAPLLGHIPTGLLPALLPLAFAATLAAAGTTFLLLERPAMQFGKRLANSLPGARARLRPEQVEVAP